MLSAVIFISFCAVFKTLTLNASYAVRAGTRQSKEKNRKPPKITYYQGRASFELYYAVRGMQNKKLRYAYIAGVSLVLGCLTVLCLGCLNAVRNIDQEPEVLGLIKTDIYVASLEDTPVSGIIGELELENDPHVDYAYGAGVNKWEYAEELAKNTAGAAVSFGALPVCMLLGTRAVVGSVSAVSVKRLVSE